MLALIKLCHNSKKILHTAKNLKHLLPVSLFITNFAVEIKYCTNNE